jgi:uncharacterized protein YuzE
MNFNYSEEDDGAIYIRVTNNQNEMSSQEVLFNDIVFNDIIYDLDRDGNLVGVEVLDVREKTLEQLKYVGAKFTDRDRAFLKDVFGKLAAAM